MKLSITVLLCVAAGSLACSQEKPPQSANAAWRAQTKPAPLPTSLDPLAPTTTARTAEPTPAAVPEEPLLTPASGFGEPRTTSAQFVPGDLAMNQADTPEDQESIREIRTALAADKSLSESARRVSVIARHGRVWLRGQVSTTAERAAIERAARQAVGVIGVRNELAVME